MTVPTDIRSAISQIKSNDTVFIHGGAATPLALVQELVLHKDRLTNVEIVHLHTSGEAPYANPEYKGIFTVNNFFVGANIRSRVNFDNVDYIPCFLHEIPSLFRKKIKKVDVALIQVSPPDQHGFCSMGTSVDTALAAVECAKIVIAQVNPQMPRTFGDGIIPFKRIDYAIEVNQPLPESKPKPLGELELQIGRNVASIIEDGACLQMGIGTIPDAVLASLTHLKNLGIHSEMWSDGALELIEKGIVNNSLKSVHRGKTVACFVVGTKKVFDYVDNNPSTIILESAYTNNPTIIARNSRVTAINSAVEVDLTGQVCADSIGHHIISGVGGQVDFLRGAALSSQGKPIIALPSRTNKGASRLVATLKSGAGVVTTRSHIHWVATEYGIVNLFGKSISERAKALISIAHPEDRENLMRDFVEHYI